LNDFAKQKINLSRMIGLPVSQEYSLRDTLKYSPLEEFTLEEAISRASQNRKDLQAAQTQIRAAEQTLKAARAEYLPSLSINANYGAIGPVPSNSHATFGVTGSLRFPIWQGGRVRGDIEQAGAAVAQRRAEYDDLRQRVEADVRNSFLDLSAAQEQVGVAESNRALAQDTLQQAKDRFVAGVSNTIEVVQAQQAVAAADQDYIATLVAHNLAKASVARAVGGAEQSIQKYLK
jgi:outer membrane protein TolC